MKIATKTGDDGRTSLHGGARVEKDSPRIEATGAVDELNSLVGVCRSFNTVKEIDAILENVQHDLFTLGADLSTPRTVEAGVRRIDATHIARLERLIDEVEPRLEPLRRFILPGGSRSAGFVHVARAVCRRAERAVAACSRSEELGVHPLVYLNRLSDLLFLLARLMNSLSGATDIVWRQERE